MRGLFCPLRPNLCTARWHVKSRTANVVRRVETAVKTAVRVGLLQLECPIEELECIIAKSVLGVLLLLMPGVHPVARSR